MPVDKVDGVWYNQGKEVNVLVSILLLCIVALSVALVMYAYNTTPPPGRK